MSRNIIDNSAIFECQEGVGVLFSPIPGQMIAKGQGKYFLNSDTKCAVKAPPGQCRLQPNPSGAGFLPCNQATIPVTAWKGIDEVISVVGAKALTSDANTNCPLGGKICLQTPCNTLLNVGCNLTISEMVINCSNNRGENSKSDISISQNSSEDCSNCMKKKEGVKTNNSENKKQMNKEEKSDEERVSDSSSKYALCPYKKCNEKDHCPYYCAKPEVDNDSAELKRQFEQDRSKEYHAYKEFHDSARKESNEFGWGYEGHHIISGHQVFMAKDCEENLKYGHLLMLASMCGYDINNANNCILLPSMARREGLWGCLDNYIKEARAFDVMDIMKRQWHLGGHSYTITKDSLKYYKPSNEQLIRSGTNEYFPDYVTSVQAKLNKLNAIYSRTLCWKKRNNKEFRDTYIKKLNNISSEIEQILLKFGKKPKDCYPFFVSKISVDYAYDAPKTGKIIIVYEHDGSVYASKFRVSRKQKDDYQIIVTQNQEIPEIKISNDTMLDFIRYCENIIHFWIDSKLDKELPWDCSNEFISKRIIDEESINSYAVKFAAELFTFIDKNESKNQGSLAQIRKRWKEAKENGGFYD